MKSVESGWRRISAADDGLEQLSAMVNDNIRLQVNDKRRVQVEVWHWSSFFLQVSRLIHPSIAEGIVKALRF